MTHLKPELRPLSCIFQVKATCKDKLVCVFAQQGDPNSDNYFWAYCVLHLAPFRWYRMPGVGGHACAFHVSNLLLMSIAAGDWKVKLSAF